MDSEGQCESTAITGDHTDSLRAGDGNRTRMTSLEGWSSAIELRPRGMQSTASYFWAVAASLYERVGGERFFVELVDRFYEGVAGDPTLRPMYPDDLTESRRHLSLFLIQYWGGPKTYVAERGHPRLRMRHAPHPIDEAARDAWLRHRGAAIGAAQLEPSARDELGSYFEMAAHQLQNL